MNWPVQEAKARFSELLRVVSEQGTQVITYRGEPAYEIRKIDPAAAQKKRPMTLLEALKACPKVPEFELPERQHQSMRKVDFGDE
jgi:antitoxin (DNA-binding transcriptional repressor) of toxin-antitoxin stability system